MAAGGALPAGVPEAGSSSLPSSLLVLVADCCRCCAGHHGWRVPVQAQRFRCWEHPPPEERVSDKSPSENDIGMYFISSTPPQTVSSSKSIDPFPGNDISIVLLSAHSHIWVHSRSILRCPLIVEKIVLRYSFMALNTNCLSIGAAHTWLVHTSCRGRPFRLSLSTP